MKKTITATFRQTFQTIFLVALVVSVFCLPFTLFQGNSSSLACLNYFMEMRSEYSKKTLGSTAYHLSSSDLQPFSQNNIALSTCNTYSQTCYYPTSKQSMTVSQKIWKNHRERIKSILYYSR